MKWVKSLVFVIIITFALISPVYAAEPYSNYVYDSNRIPQAEPQAYLPEKTISGESLGTIGFNTPMDVFVAADKRIYIVDSGNNRVLILRSDLTLEKIIDKFDNNGTDDTFNNPQGIYITETNEIFIADTGNSRVIALNTDNEMILNLGKPSTDVIIGDYDYQPVKVAVDKAGRIYVVSLNLSEGIVEYDQYGNFISFFGAVKTIPDLTQIFWRFASQYFPQVKDLIIKNIPTEYSSIAVDNKGFIMGTVGIVSQNSDKNFVKRLNPMGIDVLRRYDIIPPNGDVVGSGYNPTTGEIELDYSHLCDVAIRENGIYSVLDYNMGRVFTYSFNGELMYVFGAIGSKFGQMGQPVALDVLDNAHYLVVDSKYNQIVMYKPTSYGQIISSAVGNYFLRNYEKSGQDWENATYYTAKSRLVYDGYAKALFKMGDYKSAMKFYKYAKDDYGYSDAYEGHRQNVLEENFTLIFILISATIIILFIYRVAFKKKTRNWRNKNNEASKRI